MGGGAGIGDHGCERARAWASLELDGELSQLETALLDAHLRRCPACAALVAGMSATTSLLRAAPLERPSAPVFASAAPSRVGRRQLAARLALAAALAALAAGLGVVAGSIGDESRAPTVPSDADIALLPSRDDELDQRRRLRPQPDEPLVQPLVPEGSRLRGV